MDASPASPALRFDNTWARQLDGFYLVPEE